ncbi:MAG: acyltransferase [Moorea sp. SIO2B7]|nr:acyltransferase [Moorena sp. SIO2B7]
MTDKYTGVSMKSTKRERLRWVDYAKGIGIFLVVFGHTIRSLVNSSILQQSKVVLFSDQWIYGFHMPLFFFLSGLFLERAASKPLKDFLINRLKIIVYPYVVWSLLQGILQVIASSNTNNPVFFGDLWRIIYDPLLQFWFLYTLFLIILAYAITRKLGVSPFYFLIISILIYLLHIFGVSFGPWGMLYLVRRYAIYLALGVLFGLQHNLLSELNHFKNPTLSFVMISGFLGVALAVTFNLVEQTWAIPLIAMLGITASISLAILLEKSDTAYFVEQWGRLSLEIYVAHTIASAILRIVLQKFFGFVEPITHVVLGTAIGIYAPILLVMICQRIGFRYMFTFGYR